MPTKKQKPAAGPRTRPYAASHAKANVVVYITDGNQGLECVPVSLSYLDPEGIEPQEMETDSQGVVRFGLLVPGWIRVSWQQKFIDASNASWLLPAGQPTSELYTLSGGESKYVGPIMYEQEEFTVETTVLSRIDGGPLPDVLVELHDPKTSNRVASGITDANGKVRIAAGGSGDFEVWTYDGNLPSSALLDKRGVTLKSSASVTVPLDKPSREQVEEERSVGKVVTETAIDATAYPILTEEVNFPTPAPRAYGPGAPGTGSLGMTVETALRDVLGWRPKTTDPKGFNAALTQSFSLKWVEGHTEATWVPRNYAVSVQADMGAITGAQASIYSRAKVALDQSLPLLDGLTSLRTDILPEDQEATRAIVRSELTQLVNELGIEGGPRVQRVDELFGYLLGVPIPPPASAYPITADELVIVQEQLHGETAPPGGWPPFPGWPLPPLNPTHVGELGLRFGMQRNRVNTIEDEQDLTNFIILVDYLTGLWQTWIAQRQFFDRTNKVEPFFGTQLVLVSRDLAVVAEAVEEVNFTMDSVFLGPSERQTLQLNFTGTTVNLPLPAGSIPNTIPYPFNGASPLFVAELLDWINRVATEEGPRFIQDSGKDGVAALNPTLNNLRAYARGALVTPIGGAQKPNVVPRGYRTPRVQRAIRELADTLDQAFFDASPIQPLRIPNE
jgi:hypothetical protein